MGKFVQKLMEKLVKSEPDPVRLAWSVTLGLFIAFSPYLGIQTVLVFVLSFLLRANSAVAFIVLYTVNNPWTMIPIAALDYLFGRWLLETMLGLNLEIYDPSWMVWVNTKISFLTAYLGIKKIIFWYFFIGGNIIACLVAIASYPFMKYWCRKLVDKYSQPKDIRTEIL